MLQAYWPYKFVVVYSIQSSLKFYFKLVCVMMLMCFFHFKTNQTRAQVAEEVDTVSTFQYLISILHVKYGQLNHAGILNT